MERKNQQTTSKFFLPSPHPLICGNCPSQAWETSGTQHWKPLLTRTFVTLGNPLNSLGPWGEAEWDLSRWGTSRLFSHMLTSCPCWTEDCSPLCVAAHLSMWFASRDPQLFFHICKSSPFFLAAVQLDAWLKTEGKHIPKSVGCCWLPPCRPLKATGEFSSRWISRERNTHHFDTWICHLSWLLPPVPHLLLAEGLWIS